MPNKSQKFSEKYFLIIEATETIESFFLSFYIYSLPDSKEL